MRRIVRLLAVLCVLSFSFTPPLSAQSIGSGSSAAGYQASGPMGLSPGERGVVYFQIPQEKVTTLDAGAATTLKIFADKAGAPLSIIIQNP